MLTCACPNCGKNFEIPNVDQDYIFCNYCGAKISLSNRTNVNYTYIKREETSTHTEHIVDDAKIKSADNVNRIINLFAEPIEQKRAKAKSAEAPRPEKDPEQQRREEEAAAIRQAEERKRHEEQIRIFKCGVLKAFNWCRKYPKRVVIITSLSACIIVGSIVGFRSAAESSALAASHKAELNRLHEESIAASHHGMGEAFLPTEGYSDDYRVLNKSLQDAGFTNITLIPENDLDSKTSLRMNRIIEVTVDGSPKFEKGTWIDADTPIDITYHSFSESSANSFVSEKDMLSKKVQDTVDTAKLKVKDAAATAASKALDEILDMIN